MAASSGERLPCVRGFLLGWHRAEQGGESHANGGTVTWERELFHLAGCVLATREAALDFHLHGGVLPDGGRYDHVAIFVGELTYGAEMHLVLKKAGMLPAQRLARCAGRLLARERGVKGIEGLTGAYKLRPESL
jgi:hypothetical protein